MNTPIHAPRQSSLVRCLSLVALLAGCAGSPVAPPVDYSAIVAAPDRSSTDRVIDQRRKPDQLLAFMEVRPGMKALDISTGGGYTTELLARSVAPGGVVYAQDVPAARGKVNFEKRAQGAAMKNVTRVERPFDDPAPPGVRDLDLITFIFNYHDTTYLDVDRAKMNRQIFQALKPGGVLVIADHSARPGDGAGVGKSLHRIEESVVRREVGAAGFRFVSEGGFLRNPEDPRDVPVSKSKIPNDEFVLKFRKPD